MKQISYSLLKKLLKSNDHSVNGSFGSYDVELTVKRGGYKDDPSYVLDYVVSRDGETVSDGWFDITKGNSWDFGYVRHREQKLAIYKVLEQYLSNLQK